MSFASHTLSLACAIVFVSPALAQEEKLPGRFYPPAGCTEILTVQSENCEVANIWTCTKDAEGDSWRASFGPNGLKSVAKIDYETQWVERFEGRPMNRIYLNGSEDPASLSELLETGVDTMDFLQHNTARGIDVRVIGVDELTGDDIVIDGEPLLGTRFALRFEENGKETLRVSGNQYVSVKYRRFFGNAASGTSHGRSFTDAEAPVDFIHPGEEGFFATRPLYNCEVEMASGVEQPRLHPASSPAQKPGQIK